MASSRPGTPANDLRGENGITIAGNSLDGGDSDVIRAEKLTSEKEYS